MVWLFMFTILGRSIIIMHCACDLSFAEIAWHWDVYNLRSVDVKRALLI